MADDPTGTENDGTETTPPGAGEVTPPPANGPGGGEPTNDDGQPNGGEPTPPEGGGEPTDGNESDDPAVKRANGQAAKYRKRAQEAEAERDAAKERAAQLDAITAERDAANDWIAKVRKLTDPNAEDDAPPPTAEELAAQFETERTGWTTEREQLQQENRNLRVAAVLPGLFTDAKVEPKLATALLKSEGVLAELDPAADDFTEKAKAAVEKIAAENPQIAVNPGPRRSGGEAPTGPKKGGDQLSLEQFKALSPEEADKAIREGRCRNILGG